MIDDRQHEAAALYAFDLLEGAERAAFEAELAANAELRTLVSTLRDTTADLALLAPAATPSPALRDRVLASVAKKAATPFAGNGTASTPQPSGAPAAHRAPANTDNVVPFRLPSWLGWAAAACFAAASVYFAQSSLESRRELQLTRDAESLARIEAQTLRNQAEAERIIAQQQSSSLKLAQSQTEQLRTALETERATAATQLADLQQRNQLAELKVATLTSLAGNSPEARAVAVWNPQTQRGLLTVASLPPLEQKKDYQLWIIDPRYPAPVSGGVFKVDPATGVARVEFKADQPVADARRFAVSLEQEGGAPKAEGPLMLISPEKTSF